LAAGGLLVGVGGIMAIPPPPPAASAAVVAPSATSAVADGPAAGDPSPATGDAAARQQAGLSQAGLSQSGLSQTTEQQIASGQPEQAGTAPADAPADAPTLLDFPELHQSAPVAPVSVADDGNLGIPDDPMILGWWRGGAAPGATQGAVVVDGHVDSDRYGIGFFVNLRQLRPGEHVVLKDATGTPTRWTVVEARKYPRDDLPADALFSRAGPLRLVMITCGGVFDRVSHSYPDNLVVLAVPDGG
jgi:hypothetical protein